MEANLITCQELNKRFASTNTPSVQDSYENKPDAQSICCLQKPKEKPRHTSGLLEASGNLNILNAFGYCSLFLSYTQKKKKKKKENKQTTAHSQELFSCSLKISHNNLSFYMSKMACKASPTPLAYPHKKAHLSLRETCFLGSTVYSSRPSGSLLSPPASALS